MMEYADAGAVSPPATEAAFFLMGVAFFAGGYDLFAVGAAGFLTGARCVVGFFGTPLTCIVLVAILSGNGACPRNCLFNEGYPEDETIACL